LAVIKKLPGLAIINGFKGTLDFYVWNGINCVRSWPRPPEGPRSPAVQATWPAFSWATKNWQSLSQEVQDAYRAMAAGTSLTGRDLFIKLYITKKYTSLE